MKKKENEKKIKKNTNNTPKTYRNRAQNNPRNAIASNTICKYQIKLVLTI
ncbi:hypothetical protein [Mesomycoplasma hyopneumoniae]|nr:hypothetical protein [Mesomycoplasma hyopneumoniae]UIF66842.1 hypothetical protein KUD10_02465 [Mesomycoplasma hyopneumoniae]